MTLNVAVYTTAPLRCALMKVVLRRKQAYSVVNIVCLRSSLDKSEDATTCFAVDNRVKVVLTRRTAGNTLKIPPDTVLPKKIIAVSFSIFK